MRSDAVTVYPPQQKKNPLPLVGKGEEGHMSELTELARVATAVLQLKIG